MKKNLIIGRCGVNSLHMNWIKDAEPNFDLIVTFYGDEVPEAWHESSTCYEIVHIKGPKWKGLYNYLSNNNVWKKYEYILLPDDDLFFNAKTINTFFEITASINVDLSQPALDKSSFFSHVITLEHDSFNFRRVNFVELMAPCFSRRFLELALPVFNESDSGWGMDYYWWYLLNQYSFSVPAIIDKTTITHTRPVGSAGHGVGLGSNTPEDDMRNLMTKYDLNVFNHVTFGGQVKDNEFISMANEPDRFAMTLISDLVKKMGQANSYQIAQSILAFNHYIYQLRNQSAIQSVST